MTGFLVTTPVTGRLCHRCHALILTGTAEGIGARVDTIPLNRDGEIHALLRNRWTYTLTRGGLVHRDPHRIAGTALKGPVVADHHCGHRIPAEHRAPAGPAATTRPDHDQPPY